MSIAEAARLTGLSKGAIRARVACGELRAVRRGGLLRIAVDELSERGLLETGGGDDDNDARAELLDRIERQAEEIGRLRVELALAQRKLEREHQRKARRP